MSDTRKKWFSRDADTLRADLLRYARANFGDQVVDFSPASLGGMLLEMPAQVGDSFQYYLDYAFAESQWDEATEIQSIERFLRDAGVIPSGASPSSGEVNITLSVPADPAFSGTRPLEGALPTIKVGTSFRSGTGILFQLVENIDFSRKDANGDYLFDVVGTTIGSSGEIREYRIRKRGIVVSGQQTSEQFSVGSAVPFKALTLTRGDVHDIVSVIDASGRRWFEVDNLAQDIAFTRRRNLGEDRQQVPSLLRTVQTTRRFVREYSLRSGKTSIRFGAGTEPVVSDVEDFTTNFRNAQIVPLRLDASSLGRVRSFGEAPANTDVVVTYRFGGGLSHNVPEGAISSINELEIDFPNTINSGDIEAIVASISINNPKPTSGGAPALTPEEWRSLIPLARAAQNRVVSPNDLIGKALALPGEFGRVHKAATRPSYPGQPARLWVVCRDKKRLTTASNSLKENLRTFISEQRLIGDAVDILDCPILNWALKVRVSAAAGFPKQRVYTDLTANLSRIVVELSPDPDSPLDLDRLRSRILRTRGVDQIISLDVMPRSGIINGKEYSDYSWSNTRNEGKIVPPPGGVFEMLDLNSDIFVYVE